MVQRHAARYALKYRYASISEMISELGLATLESRRNILRTVMMYKIMNKLVDVPTDAILFPSTLQLRGHTKRFSNYLAESMHAHMPIPFFHMQSNYGMFYHNT